jgi:hypothetical protein
MLADVDKSGDIDMIRSYFGDKPVEEDVSLWDYMEAGGVMLRQRRTTGMDGAAWKALVGERAIPVAVGTSDGVLVWGDPHSEGGFRPYNVFWSDGSYDWALESGFETPDDAVDMARSTVCGPL